MRDRKATAAVAAQGLRELAERRASCPALIGFDGFVDSIIAVVDQRHDADTYKPIRTIDRFGGKITAAAGASSNYELVVKLQKLGGNGPIMANAVATAGLPTTYIGTLGREAIHPVFEDFSRLAACHSIADPGFTDALEFEDGKLMLGKLQSLKDVNRDRMLQVVGEQQMQTLVNRAHLIGGTNWTMLPRMNEIFEYLVDVALPAAPPLPDGRRRTVFVDLADPEKRTRQDLAEVLQLLGRFQQHVDMTLGVNLKESNQVAEALGLPTPPNAEAAIEQTAAAIRGKMGIHCVVIHPRAGAAAAMLNGDGVHTADFRGPFVRQPKLSTGAGDNFNAGFCLGLLAGLDIEAALCAATAASGYYVRHANSPTLEQLAAFCDDLPEPQ